MNRRQLLLTGIIGIGSSLFPIRLLTNPLEKVIKPKVLKEGDKAGIIAPGSAVPDPEDIQKALQVLQYFHLEPKIANNLQIGSGYKSRSVNERIDDLHQMFNDNEINAVFCIRGGYGSAQLLDKIDYDLLKNNPKVFIGYSDITAMHLAINEYSGLVTFHGPVLLSAFSDYTIQYFRKAMFSSDPIGEIKNPAILVGARPAFPTRVIRRGVAKGKLTGGNLSLISSLMGTPYEIDTSGKILFLEDVGEKPYRIDRMLTQLNLSKKLDKAAGIIFGRCSDCTNESSVWDYSLGEILDRQLSKLNIPVLYGLLIGHTPEQVTLPYGINSELDTEKASLTIIESCFE